MRPNWWSDHPSACTCVDCNEARLAKRSRLPWKRRANKDKPTGAPMHHPECTCFDCNKAAAKEAYARLARMEERASWRPKGISKRPLSPVATALAISAGVAVGIFLVFPILRYTGLIS